MRDDKRFPEPGEDGDALDRRIDAALRSYMGPPETTEPRIVVARIMERARAEQPSGRGWWIWGVAGATACLLALIATLWLMRTPRVPQIAWRPPAPGAVTVPVPSVRLAASPANRRKTPIRLPVARKELAVSRRALPKLDVFPTPQPLTPEEQALVDFAKHGPPAVKRAVLEDQKHWDDPIIVAELEEKSPQPGNQKDR